MTAPGAQGARTLFRNETTVSDLLPTDIIRRIADAEGTPFYVYGRTAIERNYARLSSALGERVRIMYSMKANPNPHVVGTLVRMGAGVEVASGGELRIALACGVDARSVVFAGPGKTDGELRLALRTGVSVINAESTGEIERIEKICEALGETAEIAIRVNPSEGIGGARIRMGGRAGPFGIDQEKTEDVLRWVSTLPRVRCVGIHVYAGTQVLDAHSLCDYVRRVIRMGLRLAANHRFSAINVGGGFGVPYYPGQQPLDMGVLAEAFREIGDELDRSDNGGVRLYAESGRYLVADAGCYVAGIVDIKESRKKTFVVLDGGGNHRPNSAADGAIVRRNRKMRFIVPKVSPKTYRADIVGPLCSTMDRLAEQAEIPAEIAVGDLVVIEDAGAYGRSASPLGFLSHDWPAEFMVTGDAEYVCVAPRIEAMDIYHLQNDKAALWRTNGR